MQNDCYPYIIMLYHCNHIGFLTGFYWNSTDQRGSLSTWDSGEESRSGSFSTWDNGLESRTFSLPESTRYSSLRQPSQTLSQYITPGYSDLYDSKTGIAAELQRQSRFQDLSSKQSHQFGSTATNSLLSAHILSPFFH